MQVRSCCICLSVSHWQAYSAFLGYHGVVTVCQHCVQLSFLGCWACTPHFVYLFSNEPLLSLTTVSDASLTGGQCFASLVSRAYLPKTEIAGRINCISKCLRDYRISYNNVPFHFPCAVFSFLYFYWLWALKDNCVATLHVSCSS